MVNFTYTIFIYCLLLPYSTFLKSINLIILLVVMLPNIRTTENISHLDTMIKTKEYLDSAIRLQYPPLDQIIPIRTINDMLLMDIEKASFKSLFNLTKENKLSI
ncbi:hypothetical protein TorRG33x02_224990 [Trema orientale]|uniref:Uncharacterized protein n=1 Tax=Trema orientale TaxID=63057 RepID=A0A2P5E857_TREOI|nr:hypothetical protein TorRG33x02_224990 [Trema orientale]